MPCQDCDLLSTRNAFLATLSYTVTIRVNLFEWKACNVLSGMIISKKCREAAVGLGRACWLGSQLDCGTQTVFPLSFGFPMYNVFGKRLH